MGRRKLARAHQEHPWEIIEFKDYGQKEDDGHNVSFEEVKELSLWRPPFFSRRANSNSPFSSSSSFPRQTISLGICSADGSLHFSFDNHDTPLVYRRSLADLTTNPTNAEWSTASFSQVLNVLPGLENVERSAFEVRAISTDAISLSKPREAPKLTRRRAERHLPSFPLPPLWLPPPRVPRRNLRTRQRSDFRLLEERKRPV